ncbi:antibiotic biosynthesis monooxygenase [Streptomyces sp. AJS327]|uniref:antibiotic biosynthesis monooxygenase n=1 Tax=Streptomyces sp. AJS327 TaxID=2545265 RepID=UPI0015DFD489|nr:antibiotic biosynthesis monooxygenase [Streptomyces sp. AJS327]MBA0052965.1 antibiotic biosynthesis monooxygenase [Streptomyces sp. AJS327]
MTVHTATIRSENYPDPLLAGVGAPMFSTWRLGTPERQRAAVEAIARTWEGRPWPVEGLLGYHVFRCHDGETLGHFSQWASPSGYEDFARDHRQSRNDEIDAAVPGIERVGLHGYELYRSTARQPGDDRVPGCLVTAEVEFDGPDPDRQRAWVDTVFEALDISPGHPDGLSAHFHLGTDGRRVLNYTEWMSAEAHEAFLAIPANSEAQAEAWRRVQVFPGLVDSRVRRYELALSFTPGTAN